MKMGLVNVFRAFRKARQVALSDARYMQFSRYALGEIFLVVIGILIALQINNWNEERKDQNQITQYAHALISDLEADLAMLDVVLRTAQTVVDSANDLEHYMWRRDVDDVDNVRLVYHTTFGSYRPYSWNLSALNQILNSGAMRKIRNEELVRLISEYHTVSRHLDSDYLMDVQKSNSAELLANEIVDTNLQDIVLPRWGAPYGYPPEGLVRDSSASEPTLLIKDQAKLGQLVNTFSSLGGQIEVRVERELPEHIARAERLIELLEAEYPR
jgi:hypothetical protein